LAVRRGTATAPETGTRPPIPPARKSLEQMD
jgi:hypothetical protein